MEGMTGRSVATLHRPVECAEYCVGELRKNSRSILSCEMHKAKQATHFTYTSRIAFVTRTNVEKHTSSHGHVRLYLSQARYISTSGC